MRKLLVALGTIAVLTGLCAPASAEITASKLTAPTDPSFFDPDLDTASQPLDVSGTADGVGSVDIHCVYDSGQLSASNVLATVPVVSGAFSATIDLNQFDYSLCRLVAINAGSGPPVNTSVFKGPVVGNSGFEIYAVTDGPAEGQLYDYRQRSAAAKGYFSVESAGGCYVDDSYPVDPATLAVEGPFWGCSEIWQGDPAAVSPTTQVGGEQVFLPALQNSERPGFRQIENLTHNVDPASGLMRVFDTEPAVTCVPDKDTCSSHADSGIALVQKQTGGTNGHTLAVNHRWVNTTNVAKQLEVTYSIGVDDGSPGWRFAGDSVYSEHLDGTVITPPAAGPGSFFVADEDGSTCPDLTDPCGSLTWYDRPQGIVIDDGGEVRLTYSRTIAPGASEVIALTYSQGFPQSAVDGYAAAAEQSFDTRFSFGKLKKNTRKGRATLAVKVPGSGRVHLEGKGLKTVSKAISEGSAKGATETVKLAITPKGKARKKLKRKGTAKLSADVTYTRTDLEPTVTTKKLKLKQAKPRTGKGR